MALLVYHLLISAFLVISTNSEFISEFTCGHLYYRSLYLDETKDVLYIGAMDRLIKVQDLRNISNTNCVRGKFVIHLQIIFQYFENITLNFQMISFDIDF